MYARPTDYCFFCYFFTRCKKNIPQCAHVWFENRIDLCPVRTDVHSWFKRIVGEKQIFIYWVFSVLEIGENDTNIMCAMTLNKLTVCMSAVSSLKVQFNSKLLSSATISSAFSCFRRLLTVAFTLQSVTTGYLCSLLNEKWCQGRPL